MKNACEAYLNARKELTILLNLKHDNIVPLLGISLHPLCLILRLAPQGALDKKLQDYKRAGARLPPFAIRNIVIQVGCNELTNLFCYLSHYWRLIFINLLVNLL